MSSRFLRSKTATTTTATRARARAGLGCPLSLFLVSFDLLFLSFFFLDLSPFSHLNSNFLIPFGFTYAELAQQDGVMEMWTRYVEESAPEGGAPRGRWRAEAAEALALLLSAEYANKLVRFVCEVQVLLLHPSATFVRAAGDVGDDPDRCFTVSGTVEGQAVTVCPHGPRALPCRLRLPLIAFGSFS